MEDIYLPHASRGFEKRRQYKAMVGDIGVFIFCVIVFDFEEAVNRCQAPMLLPQGDPDSRYFPHKVGE